MDILKFWIVGFVRRFAPNRTPKIAAIFLEQLQDSRYPKSESEHFV